MTMETRKKSVWLLAILICTDWTSSLALMTGTPSPPWMIHLSQVISISISFIFFGMVAELICAFAIDLLNEACTIRLCHDSKIRSTKFLMIGPTLALLIGASSLALIIRTSLLALIGTSLLARAIHISHVSTGSILFRREAKGIDLLVIGISRDHVEGPDITSSNKPKSYVYSKIGRICLGIRTSLSFFFEKLCFPELGLAIDLSEVSISISLFGMVALAEISLQVRVKKHGQGQSSSGPAGGSGSGNAVGSIGGGGGGGGGGGDENGTISHGNGQGTRRGTGGGGQGRGNDDDDDNGARRVFRNLENGRRPRNPTAEEIATIFLQIIIQSIANIMSLNDAELSTTGRVIRHSSMIINSVGFICCAAVLWQPYTNPRVARILNPRITGIFSRIGSALAVLGFTSMMGVNLPLYPALFMGLAFLVMLAVFLIDIFEAIQ